MNMKIYFSPGACSMASHIALNEAKIQHDMEKVDLKTHTYGDGKNFYDVHPKGYVPVLEMTDGNLLTENAVVLQYICDQKPELQLMPKAGSAERYRAQEWLNYIATELHKNFGAFFKPDATDGQKTLAKELITKKLALPAKALEKSEFLNGDRITAPDFYLFVMLTWAQKNNIDISSMPSLMKFHEKISKRESVRETMKMEGLS